MLEETVSECESLCLSRRSLIPKLQPMRIWERDATTTLAGSPFSHFCLKMNLGEKSFLTEGDQIKSLKTFEITSNPFHVERNQSIGGIFKPAKTYWIQIAPDISLVKLPFPFFTYSKIREYSEKLQDTLDAHQVMKL